MTTFSIIVATRNRPAALALSLPLYLSQSRLPERIVVVDSSDDPSANQSLVERLATTAAMSIVHMVSPAGGAKQRNIGLEQVTSDVTFFPDDDSLVYPGALAAMMRIYDLDEAGRIGGVCGFEVGRPPKGVLEDAVPYELKRSDRLKVYLGRTQVLIEDRLAPNPMKLAAHRFYDRTPPAEPWLAVEDALRVEWMTGFRMSFRTAAIRQVGFNERLGRYALFEDVDASLGVLAQGRDLVATARASVYHHRSPEHRGSGYEMGMMHVLNPAYVTCRFVIMDPKVRATIHRYARYKAFRYQVGTLATPYDKERFAGARAAVSFLDELCAADREAIDETYLKVREACLRLAPHEQEGRDREL